LGQPAFLNISGWFAGRFQKAHIELRIDPAIVDFVNFPTY